MIKALILEDGTKLEASAIDEVFVTDTSEDVLEYPHGKKETLYFTVKCIVRMKDKTEINGVYFADAVEMPGLNYSYADKSLIQWSTQ